MTSTDIALLRLHSQQIATNSFTGASNLVDHMGALQAQDYAMSKWAVGLRVAGASEKTIEQAFEDFSILRTHIMRPTWQIVSANNIYWLLNLTAPQIKGLLKSRNKELGITETILLKGEEVIKAALLKDQCLTRAELNKVLVGAGISIEDQRASHIMLALELDAIICSGPSKGKQASYALLKRQVQISPSALTEDEALAKLALKYFSSHGPASLEDFTWWSGLAITKSRKALEMASTELDTLTLENKDLWFAKELVFNQSAEETVYLLPAYDEFIISYKDRSAALSSVHLQKVLNKNGIFWPVIIFQGQVIGTWSRNAKKDKVLIEASFFRNPTKKLKEQTHKAAFKYATFLQLEADVKFL